MTPEIIIDIIIHDYAGDMIWQYTRCLFWAWDLCKTLALLFQSIYLRGLSIDKSLFGS